MLTTFLSKIYMPIYVTSGCPRTHSRFIWQLFCTVNICIDCFCCPRFGFAFSFWPLILIFSLLGLDRKLLDVYYPFFLHPVRVPELHVTSIEENGTPLLWDISILNKGQKGLEQQNKIFTSSPYLVIIIGTGNLIIK